MQDDREQLAQLAFEVFNVSGLFFADQALLSLFAVGKSTGLVIDFGHTKTGMALSRSLRSLQQLICLIAMSQMPGILLARPICCSTKLMPHHPPSAVHRRRVDGGGRSAVPAVGAAAAVRGPGRDAAPAATACCT